MILQISPYLAYGSEDTSIESYTFTPDYTKSFTKDFNASLNIIDFGSISISGKVNVKSYIKNKIKLMVSCPKTINPSESFQIILTSEEGDNEGIIGASYTHDVILSINNISITLTKESIKKEFYFDSGISEDDWRGCFDPDPNLNIVTLDRDLNLYGIKVGKIHLILRAFPNIRIIGELTSQMNIIGGESYEEGIITWPYYGTKRITITPVDSKDVIVNFSPLKYRWNVDVRFMFYSLGYTEETFTRSGVVIGPIHFGFFNFSSPMLVNQFSTKSLKIQVKPPFFESLEGKGVIVITFSASGILIYFLIKRYYMR